MNREQTRVLVIDDEPSVRKVLRDILATFGFQTDAVADGPAGIEQFRQHGYDVVITDLLMPGMTGVEVAAKLRDLDPKVGLILLTGSSSPAVSCTSRCRPISWWLPSIEPAKRPDSSPLRRRLACSSSQQA
jgi:CheY-like chemotaxis protein